MTRVALRLARNEPVAYLTTWFGWVVFFSLPLLTGLLVKVALDRVADGSTSGVWALIAAVVGIEAVRWTWLVAIAVQWHGCWVGWQTVPRVNLLRSLVDDPGPAAGRLPGAPGEAVSRFRDDVQDVAMVLDVWLDLSGAAVSATVALVVLVVDRPGRRPRRGRAGRHRHRRAPRGWAPACGCGGARRARPRPG